MLEWLIGMASALTFVVALFHPPGMILALVTLFVGALFELPVEDSMVAASVAVWLGVLHEIYKSLEQANG